MRAYPTGWKELFEKPHSTFEYRYVVNGVTYDETIVQGIPVVTNPLMEAPCIGRCCTGVLSIAIRKSANVDIPKASPMEVYMRIRNGNDVSDWASVGYYWVSQRRESPNLITLTCRDAMSLANQVYLTKTSHTEWPITMQDALNEISSILGVAIDSRTQIISGTGYYVDYPNEDTLMSEVLSSIAAAHGGIFVITPTNQIRLVTFPDTSSNPVFELGTKYQDYTSYSTGIKAISRITLNDSADNQFTVGDDSGIEIAADCMYATNQIAENIAHSIYIKNGTIYGLNGQIINGTAEISDEYGMYDGTTCILERGGIIGCTFRPYALTGAYVDPLIEVGDTFSLMYRGETYNVIANSIAINLQQHPTLKLSNGVRDADEEEVPYISKTQLDASRYVSTTKTYFGNKINRADGFVSELMVDDEPVARMTANANVFQMERKGSNGQWSQSIYFDPVERKYVLTGDVTVYGMITSEDLSTKGRTVINGANITTGELDASKVKIIGDDDFYWDESNIYLIDGDDDQKQIRIGRFNGRKLGIGFTKDGGKTWTTAIDFNGLNTDFTSVTETLENNYYTKAQTNSQISASAQTISTQIAGTYFTKTEAEALEDKISESGQHTYVQLDAPTDQGKGDFWVKANPLKWLTAKDNTWGATKDGTWGDVGGQSGDAAVYVWTGDEWLKTNQEAYVDTLEAEIRQVQSNLDQTDSRLSASITAVDTKTTTNTSNLQELSKTVTKNKTEVDLTTDGLSAQISANTSSISALGTTVSENKTEIEARAGRIETRVSSVESETNRMSSSITQLSGQIESKVSAGDIASSINQTAQAVQISAAKIKFEGLVTANNKFHIKEDGSVEAVDGTFSGTMSAGSWKFNDAGSSYTGRSGSQDINVVVTTYTGGAQMPGGGTDVRAFYGSSGCDVQYGADYNCQAIMRARQTKIIAQVGEGDWRTCVFKQADWGDWTDMSICCGEAGGEGDERGNIGLPDQIWSILYVRKQYRGATDSQYSSRDVKKDISPIPDMGDIIDRLKPVLYRYVWDPSGQPIRHGLIYEDTLPVLPEICEAKQPGAASATIMYEELTPILLKEIQLLRARVSALEGRMIA